MLETSPAQEEKSQQSYRPCRGFSGSLRAKEPRCFKDLQGCVEINFCMMGWKVVNVLINIFVYNIVKNMNLPPISKFHEHF